MNRTFARSACCALATWAGGATRVAAEPAEVDPETIVIVDRVPDEAARDRDRALGDAPFVTVLHPDEHPAAASVADALATSAGAQTRSLGGPGAYQSVSVRGAAPGHTAVLIDGVPLARIAAVTTDLGRFALDSFGGVELYRGAVPLELGGAGVGGAVNLVTRVGRGERGERVRASAGVGSFGARHLRAHYGDDHGRLLSATSLGYRAAAGEFTFFDDRGTLLNPDDDGYRTRGHNGFAQVDGASRIATDDRGVEGGVRASYRRQDLPGSTSNPAAEAELSTLDVVGDGRFDARVGPAVARQLAFVLVGTQRLRDPAAELGLGQADRRYGTLSGGASTTWKLPLAAHRLAAGLELRGEQFRDRDLRRMQPNQRGTRVGGGALLAIDLALTARVVVTPAMRLDVLRSAPTPMTVGPTADVPVDPRWDVVPSPRLSVLAGITDDLAIKGSTGRYVRLPTLVEVFGNRGYLLGSPDLRPERGPSSDLGVVWSPAAARGEVDRVLVSASAFASRARDTIAIATYAGYAARAINLGSTQAYGGEVVAAARFARTLSVTASYTRLVTEQLSEDRARDGNPIPRTPGHLAYARADVVRTIGGRATGLWLDGAFQSESTLDAAALGRVPARALIGAGARVAISGGVTATLSVANLTDRRVTYLPLDPPPSPTLTQTPTPLVDLAGFPLPGRSFYLSLDWTY